jgi:hypothetical protein
MKCNGRTCANEALPGAKACQRCRDWRREWKTKYRASRPKKRKTCTQTDCTRQAEPGFSRCKQCRERVSTYENTVRPKLRAKRKEYYLSVKRQVMDAYGGCKCACCGEGHLEFLSIDHMENEGAAHRKKLTGDPRNGKNFYYWLRKNNFPPGYQVLCMNCNFALGHNGFCPHHPEVRRPCHVGRPRTVPTSSAAA